VSAAGRVRAHFLSAGGAGAAATERGASDGPDALPLRRERDAAPMAPAPRAEPRVCVVGGAGAGVALGSALATRLAHHGAARAAVLCVAAPDGGVRSTRTWSLSSGEARRLVRRLHVDGPPAALRGRVAEVLLPTVPALVGPALGVLHTTCPGVPVVAVVPGVRCSTHDRAIAGHDVVLVVVAPAAPAGLVGLAVAELELLAPGAAVLAVPLGRRPGRSARRASVARVLRELP
jgi:hypothetical protein